MEWKDIESLIIIMKYFAKLKEARIFHGIADEDIYKFDKIEFKIDYRK